MLRTFALFLLLAAPAAARQSQTLVDAPLSWSVPAHASQLSASARRVRVRVDPRDACFTFKRAVITRTARAVTITTVFTHPEPIPPYGEIPCPFEPAHTQTVALGARLGQREVIDGATGKVRYPAPPSCVFTDPAPLHRKRLVTGHPTRALVCRTGHHRVLAKRAARRLARRFDALEPPPPGPGPCSNTGAEVMVVFTRPHAQPQRVLTELSGCRYVSGGGQTRRATTALLRRLRSAL